MTRPTPSPRALFVIEPVAGGAFRSTSELCGGLASRGWDITILHQSVTGERTRWFHRRWTNLLYKLHRPRSLVRISGRIGRRMHPSDASTVSTKQAAVVESATSALLDAQDIDLLVVTAVSRPSWTRLRELAAEAGVPIVFYIRGQTMIDHLALARAPDHIVVNSRALAAEVRRVGHPSSVVYSVIDLSRYQVETSRETVLVVNPNRQYGGDLALEIAALLPEIPFEFRESHSLDAVERERLQHAAAALGNVTVLPTTTRIDELYGRARLLLVPYARADLLTNRPRVVIEAQRSGIPTVGSDIPGLAEAVGRAGELADPLDPHDWVRPIRRCFEDPAWYRSLSDRAREQADDPAITPDGVIDGFIQATAPLLREPVRSDGVTPRDRVVRSLRLARHRVRARRGLRNATPPPIVIHQPGHVGSNSLVNTLRSVDGGPLVLHPHEIAPWLGRHPTCEPATSTFEVDERELARALRREPTRALHVVTVVRDPIARNVTAFLFHHRHLIDTRDSGAVVAELTERFHRDWSSRREPFERFFVEDFLPTWELTLDDFEFDPTLGIHVATTSRRHAVLKTERLGDAAPSLSELLDMDVPPIPHEQRGEKLGYSSIRARFIDELKVSPEYIERMFSSPVIERFYSTDEIDHMMSRWSER